MSDSAERQLRYAQEAERVFLGSVLVDDEAAAVALDLVGPNISSILGTDASFPA